MRLAAFIVFIISVLFPCLSMAEIIAVKPDDEEDAKASKIAKVYYIAEMTVKNASDLAQFIDRLNEKYKPLERIYIYVNSDGGNVDSGKIAYWAIKSSRTPVTTVNLSMVASAASLLFCGAEERRSLKGGNFVLHPPGTFSTGAYVQPDQLNNTRQLLNIYKEGIAEIYRGCTSLSEDKLDRLLYSENDRLILSPEEAKEKGLIASIESGVVEAPLSIVIRDSENGGN